MRGFLAFIVIGYLVGVVVVLSPTLIQAKWSTSTAHALTANFLQALPNAVVWPRRVFHIISGR
jgi:hypothetical protein